jgi:hypothetical protein
MVRKEGVTTINHLLKLYAEKEEEWGYPVKGIKLDVEHSDLADGVIHFTHETFIPEKSEINEKFEEFEKVLARN